ncbi:hypothetical protein [Dinghuibacter silviterrae]|uniref:DUF4919 domain-containing protein n=1 Tax=Dinghuibacter silviterrae TaxID=1539049 RepID=A0A4V6QA09_9BACT|nr:hypothetical protein [Dinghuibacter silviterrae]TDX02053.1 hypothetical protein EDB95_3102 [Dinghuibacter silviterrae]
MKMPYLCIAMIVVATACASASEKTAPAPAPAAKDSTAAIDSNDVFSDPRIQAMPAFGYKMIKAAIDTINDTIHEEESTGLNDSAYNALTLDQKFAYNLMHPEFYAQNCSIMPEHTDSVNKDTKEGEHIYAYLPQYFDLLEWSDRQEEFFKDNKDSVAVLIRNIIARQNRVSNDLKWVIDEANITSLIPTLMDTYKQQPGPKDHYILTLLMRLMEQNKYPEFMQSASYKKLFANGANTGSAYLAYNQANEDLIFQRATRFYNSSK